MIKETTTATVKQISTIQSRNSPSHYLKKPLLQAAKVEPTFQTSFIFENRETQTEIRLFVFPKIVKFFKNKVEISVAIIYDFEKIGLYSAVCAGTFFLFALLSEVKNTYLTLANCIQVETNDALHS